MILKQVAAEGSFTELVTKQAGCSYGHILQQWAALTSLSVFKGFLMCYIYTYLPTSSYCDAF